MSLPFHRDGQQTFSAASTQRPSPSRREIDHSGNSPTSTVPQKKDGSTQGFTPANYLTKVTPMPQPSYSEVVSAAQGLLIFTCGAVIILTDRARTAAPNIPRISAKENFSRRGLANSRVKGAWNHFGGSPSPQHQFKGSSMTRNASAPHGSYQRGDYGSHIGGIRNDDQSTYPNSTSSCYHFPP